MARENKLTIKPSGYLFILLAALVPVIIYFYFLPWRTTTAYGDDLYIFKKYQALNGFFERISMPVLFLKYRPLQGISMHLLIQLLQKHIAAYYTFNICIQAINTFIFALTLNLFLRSRFFSLLFGLTVGISRFAFFNIVQLLDGGALEGLAMSFFLASLYFVVSALLIDSQPAKQKQKYIFWSILFANASLYTHERYMVLLPFIIMLILFYPGFRQLSKRSRLNMAALALGAVCLNVILKKEVCHLPFFAGTGGTHISFSLASAMSFFGDGVLSICGINSGPVFLVGMPFTDLPAFDMVLTILLLIGLFSILVVYLHSIWNLVSAEREAKSNNWLLLSLLVLFLMLMVPAVLTIRLEQRWLQASFSIFVLMFIIMLDGIPFSTPQTKKIWLSLLLVSFFWVDTNYLRLGANNLYLTNAEKEAGIFKQAMLQGTIRPQSTMLYIWEKRRNKIDENSIQWELADGFLFDFYGQPGKKILFVDSSYNSNRSSGRDPFARFNRYSGQLLYLDTNITDITGEYLQDSLRAFKNSIARSTASGKHQNFKSGLFITAAAVDEFSTTGFYGNENGIRWTNGNAAINFESSQLLQDSLHIELNTYMPEVCRNISPEMTITAEDGKTLKPLSSRRTGDLFAFTFYLDKQTRILSVNMFSGRIKGNPDDTRILSFPFISLSIK